MAIAIHTPTIPENQTLLVYVVGADSGPHKIGYAANMTARLSQIQTGNALKLRAKVTFGVSHLNAKEVERRAHELLAAFRLNGEWFDVEEAAATAAIKEAIRCVSRGDIIAGGAASRMSRDGLRVLYLGNRISEAQYETAKRYRKAFDNVRRPSITTPAFASRPDGFKCNRRPVGERMDSIETMLRAERTVFEQLGVAALIVLRRIVGEGYSLDHFAGSGIGVPKLRRLVGLALDIVGRAAIEPIDGVQFQTHTGTRFDECA